MLCALFRRKYLIFRSYSVTSTWSTLSGNKTYDVLISGAGIMGCSTAYWLKRLDPKLSVAVVEKDTCYKRCSTVLSVGGVREQFSEPENIQMSMFCGEVLDNMSDYFSIDGDNGDLDVQFIKRGYLILCSDNGVDILNENYKMQKSLGANVNMLSASSIKQQFPWLNVDDVACGVLGSGREGWFDPWLLLTHVRNKIRWMGVDCICGRITNFTGSRTSGEAKLNSATLESGDGEITAREFVNATGCWSNEIAVAAEKACDITPALGIPVVKSKRYVFSYSCREFPQFSWTPMIVDYSGIYFRRENNGDFICGLSPTVMEEPAIDNLDVDYDWFDLAIWPRLANRVPAMEGLKVRSGWAGYYDYNTFDQNLIVGRHAAIQNLLLCNGSSGHGIQHALAVGRALSELIVTGKYQTIDLSRLSHSRLGTGVAESVPRPVYERNII